MIALVTALLSQAAIADLVGHWDLEEGVGWTTSAAVGSPDGDGSLMGYGWVTSDLAMVGDGTTAAVEFNAAGNGRLTTSLQGPAGDTPRTVSAWIKADMTQNENGVIVSWGQNSNGKRYSFRLNASAGNGVVGALRLEVQGGYATAVTPVNDGRWHHVAVTRDTGVSVHDVTLYVDGVAEGDPSGKSGTNRAIDTGTTYAVSIGNSLHSVGSYGFDGVIDAVSIYDRVLSAAEIAVLANGGHATAPQPAYGATGVSIDVALGWALAIDPNNPAQSAAGITGHHVYIGADAVTVAQADMTTAGVYRGFKAVGSESYQPGVDDAALLVPDTTHYWRIDERYADDANTVQGLVWKFTTIGGPTITQQPQDVMADADELATFVVAAEDPDNVDYAWYRGLPGDTTSPIGGNSATLEIPNAQVPDEGPYYCTLTSPTGSTDTEAAVLTIKRLMGHWKFENSLATELGDGLDGSFVGVGDDPNFVDGIDGKALEFYGDGRVVEIADSNDVFNVYPHAISVSAWVKTTQEGYGAFVSKQKRHVQPWTGFLLSHNSASGVFNIRGLNTQPATSGSAVVNDGNWHLVTGTYDQSSATAKLYVDGQLDVETTGLTNSAETNAFPLVFGMESLLSGEAVYHGQLDNVQIWNYAVDALEIARMYYILTGGSACVEFHEYDHDRDCWVNLGDFAEIAAVWLECNSVPDCLD